MRALWLWGLLFPLLLFLAFIMVMVILCFTVWRTRCLACGGRSLRPAKLPARFGREDEADQEWMYCYCRKCGAAFKYGDDKWVQVTEAEKSQLIHR